MQQSQTEVKTTDSRLYLPKSLFGFQFGYQVRRQIRELDPINDNIEHFSLTHETLYSNRAMARALPDVIFAKVAVIPEIANVLDYHGNGGIMKDPKKRNSMMMRSFGRTLDETITEQEAERLGRIHATMPIKNIGDNMKFVGDTMMLAERDMLRLVGSPEMEDYYQESIIERWTTLLEEMALAMNIDMRQYRGRSIDEIEADRQQHILKYAAPSKSGVKVANACKQDFKKSFLLPFRPVAERFFAAMFDDQTSEILGYSQQRPIATKLAHAGIRGYIASTPIRIVHKRPWQNFK